MSPSSSLGRLLLPSVLARWAFLGEEGKGESFGVFSSVSWLASLLLQFAIELPLMDLWVQCRPHSNKGLKGHKERAGELQKDSDHQVFSGSC